MTETKMNATLKAIIRYDGGMVAGLVALPSGEARFFVVQPKETQEQFVGRVSSWIKEEGATGLEMMNPDVLPEGIAVGEVLMRLKGALGIPREAGDQPDYEVTNVELTRTAQGSEDTN